MVKNILKEVIVILFLCVVIALILGIIFYDYNPIGKVVPNRIAYTTPANIAEELETTTTEEKELEPQNKIYKIEGSDLNLYKKSKAYNPSKENPFANTVDPAQESSASTTSKVESSDSSSGSEEQVGSTASSSQGTDNQATGTKAKLK